MPFLWKKVKSTRISRLVNDHLHISQKRRDGSSLVVETGFPTSLIDLFIKNREKLKKPSKKRRQITSPDDFYDDAVIEGSPISCPSPPPPPPPPPPPSLAGSPSSRRLSPVVLPPPSSCANEICAVRSSGGGKLESVVVEERGGERGGDGDVDGVLIGVLKIFMVVVLALATKRLTVGITISAVLLLFLEYVGKHCRRLSKLSAAAMPMVQIGGRLLSYKKLEQKQEPSTKPAPLPLESSASRFPVQEIQPLESKIYTAAACGVEEIQPEKETTEALEYQEIELVEMAMKREESMPNLADCKRKSRKAMIKSKMKKIVPKKFRGAKRDECVILCEDHCDKNVEESENGSISSSVSDGGYREEDGNSSICSDRRLSDVIEEADTKIDDNECKIEAAATQRYMLLCLIVLAGLIGGRTFALVLTLSWLLLLKLGQALPRSIKLTMMMMSFNVKSG